MTRPGKTLAQALEADALTTRPARLWNKICISTVCVCLHVTEWNVKTKSRFSDHSWRCTSIFICMRIHPQALKTFIRAELSFTGQKETGKTFCLQLNALLNQRDSRHIKLSGRNNKCCDGWAAVNMHLHTVKMRSNAPQNNCCSHLTFTLCCVSLS